MSFLRFLKSKQDSALKNLESRFWAKVRKTEGCWLWIGAKRKDGYGEIFFQGKTLSAHRVAYMLTKGPIPPGTVICHRCDNSACVRPSHLIAATQRKNVEDAAKKGRLSRQMGEENPMNVLSKRFSNKPLTKYKKRKIAKFAKENPDMDLIDLAAHFRTTPRRVRDAIKEFSNEEGQK